MSSFVGANMARKPDGVAAPSAVAGSSAKRRFHDLHLVAALLVVAHRGAHDGADSVEFLLLRGV